MNPKTRIRSLLIRYIASNTYREKRNKAALTIRIKKKQRPIVHYFHEVGDPYSHLAAQKLDQLRECYDIEFKPHLVSKTDNSYQGDPKNFERWRWRDAQLIAHSYKTNFSPTKSTLDPNQIRIANLALSKHLQNADFATKAIELENSLWTGITLTSSDRQSSNPTVKSGTHLRKQLGHYLGAMFFFEGEWFWGLDRLRLLEERLILEGFDRGYGLCVPEPCPESLGRKDSSKVTLEYFPSLRSPYTAAGHQRVLNLVARSGVRIKVRPVMPMLMRGIPAPNNKKRYIVMDASREARAHGVPFGKIIDPFGEPVKRALAIFPYASKNNKAMEFITAYIDAAWYKGIDVSTKGGLEAVTSNAGLEPRSLSHILTKDIEESNELLAKNLETMLESNLWGVPSFRISGGEFDEPTSFWGQDRIWRVENEIAKRSSESVN